MDSDYEKNNNNLSEKNYQEKLNSTISSDTIKILSLLKSLPSTATSSSFQKEKNKKQNMNSIIYNKFEDNYSNNIENLSYEEIKAICLKVFMLYATPNNGQFYLNQRNVFHILKEMEIIGEKSLSYIDVNILNQQVNRKGDKLNSDQFLDLLAKICCLLDDNFYKDKKTSFIKLIKLYIAPYLQRKENENINEINNNDKSNMSYQSYESKNMNLNFKDLILNEYQLDKDSFDLLISIIEGLKLIYTTYFSLVEISKASKDIQQLHKESFKIFIRFLKDFEIIPILLKQRLAELYWSIIISIDINELYKINGNNEKYDENENDNIFKSFLNNKKYNLGKIYTFKKFFLLFAHISFYYYYSIKSKTQGQKLLYIIEKIYKSKGYTILPNKYYKTFSKKFSIIPPINIVQKINKEKSDNINIININNNSDNKKHKNDYKKLLKEFIELNESNYNLLEGYLEQLKIFFDLYCHLFERSKYGKMCFTNLQKMLFDGELLLINNNDNNTKLGINSSNKNLNMSNSEKIFKINNESSIQKDTLKDNKGYYNNNTKISLNNDNVINRNSSLENKKSNSNLQSTQSIKNKKNNSQIISKPKLKIIDLSIIISKICRNPFFTGYKNNFNKTFNSSTLFDTSNKSDISSINQYTSYDIDFILFLKTLSLISLKICPNEKNDINISMNNFLNNEIEEFLSNLNKKSLYFNQNQINDFFEIILKKDEIIQLIDNIWPLIKNYFECYTEIYENQEPLCNFNSFFQFFKDYEIYPNWINFSCLSNIFYTQVFRISKENNNFLKNQEKLNYPQFLECFVAVGIEMNSGDDFNMIDKVLFMLDKMFSENYGKAIKKIKNLPSFKDDYLFYEKILEEKYPSYYERKYSNCNHRYDNKFYWAYQKNFGDINSQTQQIDFGELFNKEKVKFKDVFDNLNNNDYTKTYKENNPINEINEE